MAGATERNRTAPYASGSPSRSHLTLHEWRTGRNARRGAVAPRGCQRCQVRDAGEIERGIDTFARQPNGGLVTLGSPVTLANTDMIVTLAARHRLPAIYTTRYFVTSGGLMSYGPDRVDLYRRAAGYVDRILRGEKPTDLPVEAPTKYQLIINLKTAKALDLKIAPALLTRADEVFE
jgi:putative ABC transport system substrate-binding protein